MWTKSALLASCILLTATSATTPVPRPAQIVLIRHAEKPADPEDPHLSKAGVKRAERLVSYIRNDPAISKFGAPVAIFATRETKHDDGQRTQETVAPLAAALKLTVQTPATGANYEVVAKAILSNPAYAGKTVVLCWNHEEIPELAAALGVSPRPPKWKDPIFDQVYIITYTGNKATLTVSHYEGG